MPSGAQTPSLAERQQMRRVVALRVVPAEAVERNQHQIMLALRPGRVRAVVDVRERQRRIEAAFPAPRATLEVAASPRASRIRQESDGAGRAIASKITPEPAYRMQLDAWIGSNRAALTTWSKTALLMRSSQGLLARIASFCDQWHAGAAGKHVVVRRSMRLSSPW